MTETKYTPKQIARFWRKVDCTADLFECWLWKASLLPNGYGDWYPVDHRVRAHRFAWEITYGEIPADMFVCHRCDNPACCNPSHLFLGTHLENMRDKKQKGRASRMPGEFHPMHKLTWAQVLEIRQIYAKGGISRKALARVFGIGITTVAHIVLHETWKTDKDEHG